MISRRAFMASFAAAIAIHSLPKQLVTPKVYSFKDVEGVYSAYGSDIGFELWAALYELDPKMSYSTDWKTMTIHLRSKYDQERIREVVWKYKPVGVMATLNGEALTFEDFWKRELA